MYATSTVLSQLASSFTDTGTILTATLAAILAGAVALLGLGFGWRHLKKYVTGRKF